MIELIPFIDISRWQQGPRGIDWPTLSKHLHGLHPEAGVIIQVADGLDFPNPFLHEQRQGAHAAGIKNVGLYFLSRPSQWSGKQMAEGFMAFMGAESPMVKNEFLCWDEEDTAVSPHADLDAEVLDADGTISRPLGIHLVLYTGRWFADPHNLNRDPALAKLGLWWLSLGDAIPTTPDPWRSAGQGVLFFQYDWHGQVPGIEGAVDLNWLIGPIDRLRPFQWGYLVDPLGNKLVAGPPDIQLDSKGGALDTTMAAVQAAANIEQARRLYGVRGTPLDNLLAIAQGDAAAITLASGLIPVK